MGMACGIYSNRAVFGHAVQRCLQKSQSFGPCLRQAVFIPVQNSHRCVQCPGKLSPVRTVLGKIGKAFRSGGGQIVKLIQIVIQIADLCFRNPVILGTDGAAAFQSRPEQEGHKNRLSGKRRKHHFTVVGVHSLKGLPVYVQKGLKTAVSASSCPAEIKIPHDLAAFFFFGYCNFPLQPDIAVAACKFIPQPDFITGKSFRTACIHFISIKPSFLCVKPVYALHPGPSAPFQFCGALSEFFLFKKHASSPFSFLFIISKTAVRPYAVQAPFLPFLPHLPRFSAAA